MAVEYRNRGVVGIDLSLDQPDSTYVHRHTCMSHANEFQRAHELGLNITVHAGEAGTAEVSFHLVIANYNAELPYGFQEVVQAIEFLHAIRIGHGYRIVHSQSVYDFVKQSGAHLECCLTSSIRTGAILAPDDEDGQETNPQQQHPVRIFADDNVSFSLSTDDPAVFSSTLNQEYVYA